MIKWENPEDIENVDVALKQFFLQYKKKAVFNVVLTAKVHNRDTIVIYDTRLEEPFEVGRLKWDGSDYIVGSETIKNERFSSYNYEYSRKRSTNLTRAVKVAVEHIRPFTWDMVQDKTAGRAKKALQEWRDAPQKLIDGAISRYVGLSDRDVLEELLLGIKNGRTFFTAAFNKAAQIITDNQDEAKRRASADLWAVFIVLDGTGRCYSPDWNTPKQETDLPESIRAKIGLLKMLDKNEDEQYPPIDEVGIKINSMEFWVFEHKNIIGPMKEKQE